MRCPRCRCPVRDQLGKCVRCGCALRRGASSGPQLDRMTEPGPIGPLDDFVLREAPSTKGVSRNPAGRIPTRPAGRAPQSFVTQRSPAPVATGRRSRATAAGPTLAFGASLMTSPFHRWRRTRSGRLASRSRTPTGGVGDRHNSSPGDQPCRDLFHATSRKPFGRRGGSATPRAAMYFSAVL